MKKYLRKKVLSKIIHQGTNADLHFDIDNISQSFHQMRSELAPEVRSGILTHLLLKAVKNSLAAELTGHPYSCV